MCHFATAKLELHAYLVPLIEKFLAVANFRQVIVVIDINAKLNLFELRSRWLFVLVVFGEVVTKLAQRDNFANRRICSRRDFDQVEPQALSLSQSVRQFQNAELFAGGPQNDSDFASANPTVYPKLCLQIKSKLQASETGVRRAAVCFVSRIFGRTKVSSETLCIAAAAMTATTGPQFASRRKL
jgi:hypothetical protein